MRDFLNEMAIISDFIEKLDLKIKKSRINFDLTEESYNFVFKECQKRIQNNNTLPINKFEIKIGDVVIEFNKSIV